MKLSFLSVVTLLATASQLGAQTASDYQNAVNSQSPTYHFTFDNTWTDSVGGSLTLTAAGTGFAADSFGNSSSAASFIGSTDSLSTGTDLGAGGGPTGGNAAATGTGSLSLLFRTLDSTAPSGQRFLFAQGNTTANKNAFSMFIENTSNTDPSALKLRVGDKTTTIFPLASFSADTWYYFAMTYDETRDSLGGGEIRYSIGQAGGTLTSGTIDIGNVAVVGDNGTFTVGNSAVGASSSFRNPGNGEIDELALWNRELSAGEISTDFAALSPVPEPASLALLGVGLAIVALRRKIAV